MLNKKTIRRCPDKGTGGEQKETGWLPTAHAEQGGREDRARDLPTQTNDPSVEPLIDAILEELILGSREEAQSKYCGVELTQNLQDFSICVTCKASIAKLESIDLPPVRAKMLKEECAAVGALLP